MDKWIKLSEQLPIPNREVIVCDSLGEMQVDYMIEIEESRWWGKNLREDFHDVVYWMNLPPLPFNDSIITNDQWIKMLPKRIDG